MRRGAAAAVYAAMMAILISGCGSKGEPGPAGPSGASGTSNSILVTAGFHCAKTDNAASGTGLSFEYSMASFSSGDRFVSCSVSDNSKQSSGSRLYRASEDGWTFSDCVMTFDIDAPSGGTWTFQKTTRSFAQYYDNGAFGPQVVFTGSDCTDY